MTLPNTSDSIDAFRRARELKASALQSISVLQPDSSTSMTECSTTLAFENTLIKMFHAEGKSWVEITAHLNERRMSSSEAPTWTEAAVYSRFILSSSEPATPAREVGFEPRDYAHLRNAGSGHEGTSKAGKKRVKDFQNATELSANIRTPAKLHGKDDVEVQQVTAKGKGKAKRKSKGKDENRRKGEEEETVKMDEGLAEVLMRAVVKVERNFWVFVADEVERAGGKYIEPRHLQKVFHDI
ncbi:uncharacterized protein EKO05_0000746 [Ascochyta rabiei]|uniref:Uncharacterized protein n=1 Tax=Didymella rabiei TaxID=5454 RepID=A0A163B4U7_DIDRA|nr:uncharacterized protein EKO05_0000746 [Ascochyta rabiei]KZM21573.1 hypothetical protein ST47_g7317 [Ascochyta rabiei]UPX10074.1 hypothetical protein EKO05_0000746 [Ascochyta rabiei]